MTTSTLKVKNGAIQLPRELQAAWKNAEVLIMPAKDSLYLRKLERPSLSILRSKLRKIGSVISQKDIDAAVRWARKKTT